MMKSPFKSRSLDSLVPTEKPIVYGIVQAGEHVLDGVPYIRSTDVGGRIDETKLLKTSPMIAAKYSRSVVEPGDIVFSLRGNIGETSIVPEILRGANLTQGTARISVSDKHDGRYVLYALRHTPVMRRILAVGKGSTFREITLEDLRQIEVPSPPLPEQRKIADILSTWDEALTQLDALIEAQERRKQALMQQLLTGKKRFPGFKAKWKTASLGDVLEPITRPTAKPQGKFLAAGIRSHGKGVFLKHDFIPANIALDELFELKTGDLVVNITFAWEGAAAIVPPEADGALVSHRFPAFGFREGKAARSFFRHYIRTHRFVFDCGLASPGGAGRNRVLSKSAFLDIELPLPPIEEQQKIGDILDTADQQLTLLRTQRTALDQQKRGLMQRLLTGKLRVKP
ncbi:MAG: restriction endonuclease subunit S [Prosthecobacter sp.]|uniref:restriction endonuclease subunit S n=1 Tax=Prosthecobacter sp. TaxID=1965333 RepID=UPI003901D2ED